MAGLKRKTADDVSSGFYETSFALRASAFAKAMADKSEGMHRIAMHEMERTKRLELSGRNSEVIEIKSDVESRDTGCTQIDTHGDAEFAEIAAAWPKLPPEIRTAVVTLLRAART
jgi:hypothetical protein